MSDKGAGIKTPWDEIGFTEWFKKSLGLPGYTMEIREAYGELPLLEKMFLDAMSHAKSQADGELVELLREARERLFHLGATFSGRGNPNAELQASLDAAALHGRIDAVLAQHAKETSNAR